MSGHEHLADRVQHLLRRAQDKREQGLRFAKARAAFAELTPDEREELLAELLAVSTAGEESGAELPQAPGAIQHVKPVGYTLRDAIMAAMRDGKVRAAGEIIAATRALHPWVNEASIPAAIARMVNDTDRPLLTKRGKNKHGHPVYSIPEGEVVPQ